MNKLKLVFVEINRLPNWAIANIHRMSEIFPNLDIVLLTDSGTALCNSQLTQYCEVVTVSSQVDLRLKRLARFQNSRDTFWIYTTQRFFALCEYHFNNPTVSILHVESDVLLFPNFPFDQLVKSDKLLWGNYNLTHDVASLMYFPTIALTESFHETIIRNLEIDQSHSDMTLLSVVAKDLAVNHAYLPSIPNAETLMINSRRNWPKSYVTKQFELYRDFNGVFDHQMIGMYLDGLNPSQTYGLKETLFDSTIKSGESFIDPIHLQFTMDKNLEIIEKEYSYPLYSIHLHSKDLALFSVRNSNLKLAIDNANKKLRKIDFDLKIFWELLISNFKNGTLKPWIRHLIRFLFSRLLGRELSN